MIKSSSKITLVQKIVSILTSPNMFKFVLGLFVFQALWIALTGRYPMAFDEDFHLGIIKIYAHHISPFWNSQPEAANTYGAVFRDPSYLYHYLMSFPYRLISLYSYDQNSQVVWLRFINIGLFVWGISIFKKVLSFVGASKAALNSTLLLFVLIPVVPLLAAQINYDNLFFPMVGLVLLMTLKVSKSLVANSQIKILELLVLVSLALLTSLIKYAFLPIFLSITIYLVLLFNKTFVSWSQFYDSIISSWKKQGTFIRIFMFSAVIVSAGLFSQRYIVNTYLYHSPIPECSKVLNIEACSDYGPWVRDYNFKKSRVVSSPNIVVYSANWVYGTWFRLFFSVGGLSTQYETRGALLLPGVISIIVSVSGLLLLVKYYKSILAKYDQASIVLLTVVFIVYILVLWIDQFAAFSRTGQPVAINGRYIIPVLLPIMLFVALAFGQLSKINNKLKTILISITILGMFWGGGAMTYIIRSNDDASWWWTNAYTIDANRGLKAVFHKVMPGFYDWGRFWR